MILRSAIDALAAVLFPAPCRICATTLLTASRIPICEQCFASFEPIRNPICLCCGRPFLNRTDMAVEPEQLELGASAQTHCRQCRIQFFKFELARSFGAYNETLKKAILLAEIRRSDPPGRLVCESLGRSRQPRGGKIPRRRGGPGAVASRPPAGAGLQPSRAHRTSPGPKTASEIWSLSADANRPRPPRLVLSRKEHWDSVRGAYATRQGLRVDKLRVLLVDDVMTTGATLRFVRAGFADGRSGGGDGPDGSAGSAHGTRFRFSNSHQKL